MIVLLLRGRRKETIVRRIEDRKRLKSAGLREENVERYFNEASARRASGGHHAVFLRLWARRLDSGWNRTLVRGGAPRFLRSLWRLEPLR